MPETLRAGAPSSRQSAGVVHGLFGDGRAVPTLLLWLTFLPTLLILYLILNWLPTLAIANGLEPSTAPRASLAFNFASVAGAFALGLLVDRFGTRGPLLVAYGGLIVALLFLASARESTSVLLWSGAAGFCLLGANYALYGVAASYYPQAVRATGSGASVAVGRVGSILGPMIGGVLLSGGVAASSVMQWMAPVSALAGLAVLLLSFAPHRE
jgi:AAHS family 3-hydroxyphenylpropionic acid transporter